MIRLSLVEIGMQIVLGINSRGEKRRVERRVEEKLLLLEEKGLGGIIKWRLVEVLLRGGNEMLVCLCSIRATHSLFFKTI